jgi:hypothetical protein
MIEWGAGGTVSAANRAQPRAGARAAQGRPAGTPVFAALLDAGPGPAEAAGAAESVTDVTLASLLALQGGEHPTEQDRRARRHADAMLDEMRGLQLALLAGEDGAERLRLLADMLGAQPVATHPGLRAATEAVALRVELELARRLLR